MFQRVGSFTIMSVTMAGNCHEGLIVYGRVETFKHIAHTL